VSDNNNKHVDYAFSLQDNAILENTPVIIGGVEIQILVDSGATCNVINEFTWNRMKQQHVVCDSKKESRTLLAYGTNKLNVIGTFMAETQVGDKSLQAEFLVVRGEDHCLIGRDTSIQLGLLWLKTDNVNYVTGGNTVYDILKKHEEIFMDNTIGKLKDYKLKLHINEDIKPVVQSVRRIPYGLRKKVEDKITELERMDIIEKVDGPTSWVSPVVVAPKPSGDIRICVDMRMANVAVERERHPIPTVDEVLAELNGATIFSKIDLTLGYHQIELDLDSRDITTFATHMGLYRYKRLMFGINAAPEHYQRIIRNVLQDCEGVQNISDDIIIHGKTQEEHNVRLDKVLTKLHSSGLTANKRKSRFSITKLEFMGHLLTTAGISPTETKVEAVQKTRIPQNAKDVRSFLGLVNFCAKFIPGLATVAEPLRRLTRHNIQFEWSTEQDKSFKELKRRLTNAKTLAYFDQDADTVLISDASPVGLGAILAQRQEDCDQYRAVCYASRALSDVERRYSQTEREALGIVWACERFFMYVYGIPFTIVTDHKPLEYIFNRKISGRVCARVERWALRLQNFTFKVQYQPGAINAADSLSRLSITDKPSTQNIAEDYIYFVAEHAVPKVMTPADIERISAEDEELKVVRECINTGQWTTADEKIRHAYQPIQIELSCLGQLVLRGCRIVIPVKLRDQTVKLAHEGHQGIVKTKQRLREKVWWPGMDCEVEKLCKSCHPCQVVAGPGDMEPLHSTKMPNKAWDVLAIDIMGPFPDGYYAFVVVDYYSRYFEVVLRKSFTAQDIVDSLDNMFAMHGWPIAIRSDNGPQFVADVFEYFLADNAIKHLKTTPYWPRANGEVERQNRSLLKAIRTAHAAKKSWRSELNKYLLAYRSTPHSSTGVTPAKLMFGRELRTKLPQLELSLYDNEDIRDRDAMAKDTQTQYYNKKYHTKLSDIVVGDQVLVRQPKENKFSTNYKPEPLNVIQKSGSQVILQSQDGIQSKRNTSHVKKFVPMAQSGETVEPDSDMPVPDMKDSNTVEHNIQAPVRPGRNIKPPSWQKDYVMG
jgi:hypothetical protein